MDQLHLAQLFIRRCERATRLAPIAHAFEDVLTALGFRYFALCSPVDLDGPPHHSLILHSYPLEWVKRFGALRLSETDPVLRHAERSSFPFFWDAQEFRDTLGPAQLKVLALAQAFGVAHGYTVPIHFSNALGALAASCSVVPGSESVAPRSYFMLRLICPYMYVAARRLVHSKQTHPEQPALTRRQRQCLELAALGKSERVVGRILDLHRSTVRGHIERARRRMGVATRVQAIVLALASQQASSATVISLQTLGSTARQSTKRSRPRSIPVPAAGR